MCRRFNENHVTPKPRHDIPPYRYRSREPRRPLARRWRTSRDGRRLLGETGVVPCVVYHYCLFFRNNLGKIVVGRLADLCLAVG